MAVNVSDSDSARAAEGIVRLNQHKLPPPGTHPVPPPAHWLPDGREAHPGPIMGGKP